MNDPINTHALSKAARLAAVGEPARRSIVSPDHPLPDQTRDEAADGPKLELYHFVMSVCSQKSRTALFEAGLTFGSNELVIMPPLNENYTPEYVTLRMASEAAKSAPLVGGYSGATNVSEEGFDPLVVPTLVDHDAGRIITDSKEIAFYADRLSGGKLIPDDLRDTVMAEVDIVDHLPQAGLFYGANPEGDTRPPMIQQGMQDAHLKKIEQVERRKADLPEESPLHDAYAHKLTKEHAGRAFISDPENMRGLVAQATASIQALEERLRALGTDWVAGDRFTLADIFWGVSLFRLMFLGYDWIWEDLPAVSAYAQRCYARPSLINGAIRWPGHPPSDKIAAYLG